MVIYISILGLLLNNCGGPKSTYFILFNYYNKETKRKKKKKKKIGAFMHQRFRGNRYLQVVPELIIGRNGQITRDVFHIGVVCIVY